MFQRFLPTHDSLKQSRLLSWLGPRIHDPSLWHINRRSVAKGAAIGAFFGLLVPVAQIPAAALMALFLRANLWVAAVCTLVSNPFTYGPIYYFAYRLGARVMGAPDGADGSAVAQAPDAALQWLAGMWNWVTGIGRPLALGMLLLAVTGAVFGYWGAQMFWRLRVLSKRRRLRHARTARSAA